MKKLVCYFLICLLVFSSTGNTVSYAKVYNAGEDTEFEVTAIEFTREHVGFDTTGGFVEIRGSGLQGKEILFRIDDVGGGTVAMGEKTLDLDGLIKYVFDAEEATKFNGEIVIDGEIQDVGLNNFPNIGSVDKKNVNISESEDLVLNGSNFDEIDGTNIIAEYGKGEKLEINYDSGSGDTESKLTVEDIQAPGEKGFQNIIIRKEVEDTTNNITTQVKHIYTNSFRLVENLELPDLIMYPNTVSKGDELYFDSENFLGSSVYEAYLMKTSETSDTFTEENKCITQGLEGNVLTVTVPTGEDFEFGDYNVVLTRKLNNQIVAVETVSDSSDNPEVVTVVDADFKPTITDVYPASGPDIGSDVQIKGNNLISLNIPDLVLNDPDDINVTNPDGNDQNLNFEYSQGGTYKGNNVSINRVISVQIAGKVTFQKDGSEYKYTKGTPDSLYVKTPSVNDADDNPYRDVVIEISTVLDDGSNTYTFNQRVTRNDGYEYIPSSIEPTIDSITPEVIQVEGSDNNFKESILMSLTGENFLVNTYTNQVDTFLNYPQVLIKTTNNLDENDYDLKIDPNQTVDGVKGVIFLHDGSVLRDEDTNEPIQLEYEVLDDEELVDGTTNNEIGNRIVFKVPREANIANIGKKHIQVVNPKRFTQEVGSSAIELDILEFIKTVDVPVIETVEPSVVTVEGGVDIEVIGSNFKEGVQVFLDGKEVTGVTREIDTTGTKVVLKFEAPPNRKGATQLQIINPSGGIDVADFYYVDSFEKDPIITEFTPTEGSVDTLVSIQGDNFLKPDPTVDSAIGVDALRLLGTRVYLDGKDVNEYNKYQDGSIKFVSYESPANEELYTLFNDSIELSDFYKNVFGQRVSDDAIFRVTKDAYDNLVLYSDNEEYTLEYDKDNNTMIVINRNGDSVSYDEANASANYDGATGITTISIGGEVYNFNMSNDLLSIVEDPDGVKIVSLADYADDIVLKDAANNTFYRIYEDFNGDIVLTNGQEGVYKIVTNTVGDTLIAKNQSSDYTITINDPKTSISLDVGAGIQLDFLTPFLYDDSGNNHIYGRRSKVINKNQIIFNVPSLTTGKGYKDLVIENPDTRRDEKLDTEGFYYIHQASTHPSISRIDPNMGSTDGGYFITIYGKDFEENTSIFIDGFKVPKEDIQINLDGTEAVVKVPPCQKDLVKDFGVDNLKVPVVVINSDGGSDYVVDGFTYIVPVSSPKINEIVPGEGTSNGGQIVEIFGEEFRYFEPYINKVGGPEYDLGDEWEELYTNGVWDDLLDPNVDEDAVTDEPFNETPYYDTYKKSEILPKVYFGNNEARIVEYANGYIKVISPKNENGSDEVNLTVVNNDYGISNAVKYNYQSSQPQIENITPAHGSMSGGEKRDFYGNDYFKREDLRGYKDDDDTQIQLLDDLDSLVKFADVSNEDYGRTEPNSGLINGLRTEVNLDGGFKIIYNGNDDGTDPNTLKVFLEANGEIYKRTFENYDNTDILIPMEMLQFDNETPSDLSDDIYYESYRYDEEDNSDTYRNLIFEYVRVRIDNRRLLVDRFIAPKVEYESTQRMTVTTSSYYLIGKVPVEITNGDGGKITGEFTYTNPASEPKIYEVRPYLDNEDSTELHVKGTIDGGIQLEIIGEDLREDIKAYIGAKEAKVVQQVKKTIEINGTDIEFDDVIIEVPAGSDADIGEKYPIIVENTDFGIANSSQTEDLYGNQTKPYYFLYQVPLSKPVIEEVIPEKTSVYGGNEITLKGEDFRAGATVIIGSRGGVPVEDVTITDRGQTATFTTPENLTIGTKDLQIVNEDYGTFNKTQSINIISYPILERVEQEDGKDIDWISIEGGNKIRITGSDFHEGAKVYFGGNWTEKTDESLDGPSGLYKNDKTYVVENGIEAQSVEFIDEETLIVTTPILEKEDEYTIVVINQDTGISDNDLIVSGKEPLPSDPVGLDAEVIDDRYIKIFGYTADNVDYYEIYVAIEDDHSEDDLIDDDYEDFNYLDTTELEPYKITDLPGIEDMDDDESLYIVIKAVNKYGPSSWSNIVELDYERDDLEDIDEIGPADTDGGLGVKDGEEYEVIESKDETVINLTEDRVGHIIIDLSDKDKTKTNLVNIPGKKVRKEYNFVSINLGDLWLKFIPMSLDTSIFRKMYYDDEDTVYGRIETKEIDNEYSSLLKGYLPRGKKSISSVNSLRFYSMNNYQSANMAEINTEAEFGLTYNPEYLSANDDVGLFKFNENENKWEIVESNHNINNNSLTTKTKETGYYIILKY